MNNEVGEKFLPIGTVVLLTGGSKKLMITGYCIVPSGKVQKVKNNEAVEEDVTENTVFDYCGCVYPEGILQTNEAIIFNHENIAEVIFPGYSDKEQKDYSSECLKFLEDFKNKNNQ